MCTRTPLTAMSVLASSSFLLCCSSSLYCCRCGTNLVPRAPSHLGMMEWGLGTRWTGLYDSLRCLLCMSLVSDQQCPVLLWLWLQSEMFPEIHCWWRLPQLSHSSLGGEVWGREETVGISCENGHIHNRWFVLRKGYHCSLFTCPFLVRNHMFIIYFMFFLWCAI